MLEAAFISLGYEDCVDSSWEPGFEKVALYGSTQFYTHAARQLHGGKWTSKLGRDVDIEHDGPDDVAGGLYGEIAGGLHCQVIPRISNPWHGLQLM